MSNRPNVSLNLNVRGIGQSATLAIQSHVRRMRADGARVHNLGLGQSPFPIPDVMVEAMRVYASRNEYLPVEGLPELRRAVADFHGRQQGLDVDPGLVLVGPGSKELLFLLQLCYYGDIIVPTPCWVSYTPQSRIIGRQVRLVKTDIEDDWRLDPDQLRRQFEKDADKYRPRLFVLNYPGNPTGITYDAKRLEALAEVFREYEVLALSDEIYSGLHYEGNHVSLARYYPEGTIIANGISKWASAGGWRLGTFTFPQSLAWLHRSMAAVASETYTSVAAPVQYAAVKAFSRSRSLERYLSHLRRILRELAYASHARLCDAGIDVARPEGAFYMFPDFSAKRDALHARGIRDSAGLCEALLKDAGVAMLPGSAFERPEEEFTGRMAFVDFDGARALATSEEIPIDEPLPDTFLRDRCLGVVDAMDAVGTWFEAL